MTASARTAYDMTSKGSMFRSICGRMALAASLALSIFSHSEAATINAASTSLTDVTSAVESASDGDTVVVPSGTSSWTGTLIITKDITLMGANVNATDDLTILVDNIPRADPIKGVFIAGSPTGTNLFRITGFTFTNNGTLITHSANPVQLSGISTFPNVRIDHCHFKTVYANNQISFFTWLYGVVDHCTFDMPPGGNLSVWTSHANWNGGQSGWGSWADDAHFGSEKFVFIEDCTINNYDNGANNGSVDGARGGRWVARHNIFHRMNDFYHGTDSGQGGVNIRGTRAVEIYNNTFDTDIANHAAGQNRGGSLLFHDNTYTGPFTGTMSMKNYRLSEGAAYAAGNGSFGVADGTDPWDLNQSGGPSATGVITSSDSTGGITWSATDSTANWTLNQWVGYSCKNADTGFASYIVSNTSTTINYVIGGTPSSRLKFGGPDGTHYAFYKVLKVLDSPGLGKDGIPFTGNPPQGAGFWPNQVIEGCFSWNNTLNGNPVNFVHNDSLDPMRVNVDFFNRAPQSGDLIFPYTPYTYPHPLVSGVPAPPQGLRIVP